MALRLSSCPAAEVAVVEAVEAEAVAEVAAAEVEVDRP
jgi:hypothetical protein